MSKYSDALLRRWKYSQLWRGCVGAWNPGLGPTGATLYDWSGFQNHGSLNNFTLSSSWPASNYGTSLQFNGTTTYVAVPAASFLRPTSAISISAWINGITWPVHSQIICQGAWNTTYGMMVLGGGTPRFAIGGVSADYASTIPTGTWTHLAGTYDKTSIKLYVNGTLVKTTSSTASIPTSSADIWIGSENGTGQRWTINGLLSDVRFYYNLAITQNQVTVLAKYPGIAYEPAASNLFLPSVATSSLLLRRRRMAV